MNLEKQQERRRDYGNRLIVSYALKVKKSLGWNAAATYLVERGIASDIVYRTCILAEIERRAEI